MKVNWFSPLPPSQTGIAEYTEHVLKALAERSEVTLWTDQEQWSPQLEEYGRVRRFDQVPDWGRLNRGDATFYNIGNNAEFHASIWQISRRNAGVVILHDTHLQHLFVELFKRRLRKLGVYRDMMARYHGQAGQDAAGDYLKGRMTTEQLASQFPLTALALENAMGAVVHLPTEVDEVAGGSRVPVVYAPLPYSAGPNVEQTPPPANRGGRAEPPFRLMVFGYLGPNRRLDAILQSLQTLPERSHFRLHVYGKLHKPDLWQSRIQRENLDSLVSLHGYVSDTELDDALDQADLVINLRYPTMGEASWTQLRLWSHALPSLVTQTGWYATLPPDAVSFVRPEHEIADIQWQLQEFLRDPDEFARKGRVGWRTLRDVHAPEKYADTLLEVASQAEAFRGRANAMQLVERTGELLSQFASSEEHVPLLSRVAREIRRMAA
jgi:glycosyltransferase involved in cell wall biosynthesis